MTTPSEYMPSSMRRRRALPADEQLFAATAALRSRARRATARWITDSAAAIDAAVWAAIRAGVVDHRTLYEVACTAARRELRWEARGARRPPVCEPPFNDPAERAVARADAQLALQRLHARPVSLSVDAACWLDGKLDPTASDQLPHRVTVAGRRWAHRARRVIGDLDAVA